MSFTSEEETEERMVDHTPIPCGLTAVNFTSASLLLQLMRVATLHVLWMTSDRSADESMMAELPHR